MPVTLARSMDAVAICTCSLPTAGLPRHLPLTLSLLPRTASPTTGRQRPGPPQPPPAEGRPVCSVGSRGGEKSDRPGGSPRGLPGPVRGREPKHSGGGGPFPVNRTLPVCAQVSGGNTLFKKRPKARSVCSGKASWPVSPRYGFFKFTLPKKSVTKTNKKTRAVKGCNPLAPVVEPGC